MIADALQSFVIFGTAAAVVGFAALWLVRRSAVEPRYVVALCSAALALPPIAAAWLITAAMVPMSWMSEPEVRAAHGAVTSSAHLVGILTGSVESFAYVVLGLVGVSALMSAWVTMRGQRRLARVIGGLEVGEATAPAEAIAVIRDTARGIDIKLVQSDHPLSFLWGVRRSQLVLSTGLLRALSSSELQGVLAHEVAHHARRDNLVKAVLAVCAEATLAAPLARRVLAWRNEQVELLCDEAATANSCPLDIAEALVKVRRRARAVGLAVPTGSGFVPESDRSVERRVRRLVALADEPRGGRRVLASRVPVLVVVGSLFAASLIALAASAPLAVHVAAETALRILQ